MKRLLFICWLTLLAGILSAQTWSAMDDPNVLPSVACVDVDISSDGQYAIVGGSGGGPWFYQRVDATWTKGTNDFDAVTGVTSVVISGDGNYAYCSLDTESPYIKAFRRTGANAWTAYNIVTLTACRNVTTDWTGTWVMFTGNVGEDIITYERTAVTTWTSRAFAPGTSNVNFLAVDSTGTYAFALQDDRTVSCYFRTVAVWSTEVISGDTTPGATNPEDVDISNDAMYVAVTTSGHVDGVYVYIYLRSGSGTSSTWTLQSPDYTMQYNKGCATNEDGTYFFIGDNRVLIRRSDTSYSLKYTGIYIGTSGRPSISRGANYLAVPGSIDPWIQFYVKRYDAAEVSGVANLASVNSVLSVSIKSVNTVE